MHSNVFITTDTFTSRVNKSRKQLKYKYLPHKNNKNNDAKKNKNNNSKNKAKRTKAFELLIVQKRLSKHILFVFYFAKKSLRCKLVKFIRRTVFYPKENFKSFTPSLCILFLKETLD